MKKTSFFSLLLFFALCLPALLASAQQKKGQKKPGPTQSAPGKVAVLVPVTLGGAALKDSVMTPEEFNRRVKEGLKVNGDQYAGAAFEGFDFTYMERNIYEDSVGNFIQVVDILTERCPGDTLTTVAQNAMPRRAKTGDTAVFNNIRLRLPDGRLGIGREFRIVLLKK